MKITNFHLTKNIFIASCLFLILALMSCGKALNPLGTGCSDLTWGEEIQEELTAWVEASNSFSDEPSTENCEKEKEAILAYISALEEIRDCVPGLFLVDVDNNLDEARDEVNAISCN